MISAIPAASTLGESLGPGTSHHLKARFANDVSPNVSTATLSALLMKLATARFSELSRGLRYRISSVTTGNSTSSTIMPCFQLGGTWPGASPKVNQPEKALATCRSRVLVNCSTSFKAVRRASDSSQAFKCSAVSKRSSETQSSCKPGIGGCSSSPWYPGNLASTSRMRSTQSRYASSIPGLTLTVMISVTISCGERSVDDPSITLVVPSSTSSEALLSSSERRSSESSQAPSCSRV